MASGEEREGRGRVPPGWLAELRLVPGPPFYRMGARASCWSPELLAYRGGEAIRQPFVGWLAARGPGGPGR